MNFDKILTKRDDFSSNSESPRSPLQDGMFCSLGAFRHRGGPYGDETLSRSQFVRFDGILTKLDDFFVEI